MSEKEKILTGTDIARKEKTEDLLRIAETARRKSATQPEKFKESFPELACNYSQISSVLKERGYSVRWTSDAVLEENNRLKESVSILEKEKECLREKLKKIQEESEKTRIISLRRTSSEDTEQQKTVYLSLPVKENTAKKWKQMFGMLNVKVLLGTTALEDFMESVSRKETKIRM